MQKIKFSATYFNPKSTLECGQLFRFKEFEKGYLVFSKDKACYLYSQGEETFIECESADVDYFFNYFDLARDYSKIYQSAVECNIPAVITSANVGKGIRILNQDISLSPKFPTFAKKTKVFLLALAQDTGQNI